MAQAELTAATKQAAEDTDKFKKACREFVIKLTSSPESSSWVSTSILRKLEDG
jgi:hypothetical protein